jgi:hypothetical protein
MKYIFLPIFFLSFIFSSCGGTSSKKTPPIVDTTTIDTANVEQLEKELKDLEEKSAQVNNKLDSIDNLLNE